ncbi:glutaryl-CoA dehydrogenase [Nitzschia inconspicua]|uniref:Glutaryl-CoA dehydrogenase n=1 Tax=Nitzschia inconspicua TaxID=303405 RepID=A0A9K3PXU8_9STRA|nr:glutaryl-CoA dehydrogenase [Nitzschia inconspicua]
MKFTATVLVIAACATAATAFTIGAQGRGLATQQSSSVGNNRLVVTLLRMDTDDFAKSEIESNDVVVFSKSYCPFCKSTKELFTDLGVDFKVHELDQMGDDGPALQASLFKMTNQKTVPNVFVKGQHIGGNDNTQAAAKEGKLQEMLGIAA